MFLKTKKINCIVGFTLMEVLIAMGIITILGGLATSNYFGYLNEQAVDGATSELLGSIRDAQQRSISQDQQSAWGVYINAVSGADDYYEVFYGNSRSTGTVLSRITLPNNVEFLLPNQGSTKEITFAKSTGVPNADHIITIISANNSDLTKTIEIGGQIGLATLKAGLTNAPAISSIYPTLAWNTAPVDITNLAGVYFQSGATVKLTKTSQTDVNCTSVTFVSTERLTAVCDITGKVSGAWNVVVTNPDTQSSTLANGFLITVPGGNVSGFAWSDNIGWISFNCTDLGTCAQTDYGVSVNTDTGIFSGFAWSDNIGWISFNVADLTGCPIGACEARLAVGTAYPQAVTGWAKILSTGGWLSLSKKTGDTIDYGVQLGSDNKFSGWAWDSDTIGWLSWSGTVPAYAVRINP